MRIDSCPLDKMFFILKSYGFVSTIIILDAAPVHIGAKACPLPFNLGLEQAVLPSVKDIVDACKASLYR